MAEIELRPVHVVRLGDWRVNWRVGSYPWFIWDYNGRALSVVLRWFYVSVGKIQQGNPYD